MAENKSPSNRKQEISKDMESKIMEAKRKRDERSFVEDLGKRIHVAREGKAASGRLDYANAIVHYRKFLQITAKAFDCEVSDLRPDHFEEKIRKAECLLLSSILLDFIKILDNLESKEAKEERLLYHKLFVRFTLGQPFQAFAAENIRKFMSVKRKIKFKSELQSTYNAIKVKKFCLIATWALEEDPQFALPQWRRVRDETLSKYALGRAFTNFYYENGPWILSLIKCVPGSRAALNGWLNWMVRKY